MSLSDSYANNIKFSSGIIRTVPCESHSLDNNPPSSLCSFRETMPRIRPGNAEIPAFRRDGKNQRDSSLKNSSPNVSPGRRHFTESSRVNRQFQNFSQKTNFSAEKSEFSKNSTEVGKNTTYFLVTAPINLSSNSVTHVDCIVKFKHNFELGLNYTFSPYQISRNGLIHSVHSIFFGQSGNN